MTLNILFCLGGGRLAICSNNLRPLPTEMLVSGLIGVSPTNSPTLVPRIPATCTSWSGRNATGLRSQRAYACWVIPSRCATSLCESPDACRAADSRSPNGERGRFGGRPDDMAE